MQPYSLDNAVLPVSAVGFHLEPRRAGISRPQPLNDVHIALKMQRDSYPLYRYFNGYRYQSFDVAGMFGNCETEARFEDYGLGKHLKSGIHLLDIRQSLFTLIGKRVLENGPREFFVLQRR